MNDVLNPEIVEDEESSLRPGDFDEYIGQTNLKENLKVFVGAAKLRDESLDHVLLYGPPGLGKTTMSMIIAHEMGTNIKITTGPSIEKTGDLVAILTALEPGDVVIGKEASTRSVRIDLPPFTLVGATTRAGDLSAPLRDRFGIVSQLEYYSEDELTQIIDRTSRVYNIKMDEDAKRELARRSRGTPRIANRLFRRVRDFSQFYGDATITKERTTEALERLKVDNLGLDDVDHKYLLGIIHRFKGGPVGLEAIAASIGEEPQTLEDVNEPYLLQIGLIKRTPRGRIATAEAYRHLHISQDE